MLPRARKAPLCHCCPVRGRRPSATAARKAPLYHSVLPRAQKAPLYHCCPAVRGRRLSASAARKAPLCHCCAEGAPLSLLRGRRLSTTSAQCCPAVRGRRHSASATPCAAGAPLPLSAAPCAARKLCHCCPSRGRRSSATGGGREGGRELAGRVRACSMCTLGCALRGMSGV